MSNDKSEKINEISKDEPAPIKIKDLPVEEGSDGKAEQTKGGSGSAGSGYKLSDSLVSSVTPRRP